MNIFANHLAWGLAVFLLALLLAGCGSTKPEPLRADGRIIVGANANPGYEGKPSPVVLRIYQLKAPGLFEAADFFSLYDDERGTLGEDLISREQLDVHPGEVLSYQRDWDDRTRYIGVMAAFRDVEKAIWHDVVAIPSNGTIPLIIQVDDLSIKLLLADQY